MRELYIKKIEWKCREIKEFISYKNENMLCGPACLKYIERSDGKTSNNIPYLYWIMEIGTYLIENCKLNVELIYYHSRLMKDYKSNCIPEKEKVLNMLNYFFVQYIFLGF